MYKESLLQAGHRQESPLHPVGPCLLLQASRAGRDVGSERSGGLLGRGPEKAAPHQGLGLELGISRAWEGAAVSGEGQGKSRHLGADIRPDESLDPNPTGHHLGRTPSLWPLCEDSMDAQARPRAGVQ